MDALPVAVSWSDQQGNVEYVNSEFTRLFGYTIDDIPTIEDWLMRAYPDPSYRKRVSPQAASLFVSKGQGIPTWYPEAYVTCKDGSTVTVVRRRVLTEGRIAVVYTDITDREKAEKALWLIQGYLTEAMDMARMAYFQLDINTREFVFNDPFYALYATNAEREGGYRMTTNEYARRFVHPEDRWLFDAKKREDILKDGPSGLTCFEHRAIRRDGEVIHVFNRTKIIRDPGGTLVQVYGVNQDITDRKKANETLALNRERLEEVMDISRMAYYEIDLTIAEFTFNDTFYKLLATTAEREGGYRMSFDEYCRRFVHPDDMERVAKRGKDLKGQQFRADLAVFEHKAIRRDGKVITILNRLVPPPPGSASRIGYGVNQDITEQKGIEEELAKRTEELARSNADLERFAHIASHDLQEPLR